MLFFFVKAPFKRPLTNSNGLPLIEMYWYVNPNTMNSWHRLKLKFCINAYVYLCIFVFVV